MSWSGSGYRGLGDSAAPLQGPGEAVSVLLLVRPFRDSLDIVCLQGGGPSAV